MSQKRHRDKNTLLQSSKSLVVKKKKIEKGTNFYRCTLCEHKTAHNSALRRHLWNVHDEGDGQWFECTICEHKTKHNSDLIRIYGMFTMRAMESGFNALYVNTGQNRNVT
jgi:hypothetical protein